MAETIGTLHRQGAVEMQTDGEDHLLRVDAAGCVTLGRDVLVEPDGEGFRLSSPHVRGRAIVGLGSVVSCPEWTVNLRDEVARLIG